MSSQDLVLVPVLASVRPQRGSAAAQARSLDQLDPKLERCLMENTERIFSGSEPNVNFAAAVRCCADCVDGHIKNAGYELPEFSLAKSLIPIIGTDCQQRILSWAQLPVEVALQAEVQAIACNLVKRGKVNLFELKRDWAFSPPAPGSADAQGKAYVLTGLADLAIARLAEFGDAAPAIAYLRNVAILHKENQEACTCDTVNFIRFRTDAARLVAFAEHSREHQPKEFCKLPLKQISEAGRKLTRVIDAVWNLLNSDPD